MSVGPEAAPSDPAPEGERLARRSAERHTVGRTRRVSVIGVIGELLITAGAVVVFFISWQLWISELIVGKEQQAQAQELNQEWNEQVRETPTPSPEPSDTPEPEAPQEPADAAPLPCRSLPPTP